MFAKASARQLWLKIHRWLGLFLLAWSIPISLTGSINVYHREIDRWLYPDFFEVRRSGPPLPLNQILARVRAQDPSPVISIILPDAYWPTVLIHQRHGPIVLRTSIDPASGEILGRRDQTHALLPTLYRFHQELLLKPYWGDKMVGVIGLALALSCATGLWLWLPRPKQFLRSITVRRGQNLYRTSWDLHGALGFWSALLLLVLALSGSAQSFPDATARLLSLFSPVHQYEPPFLQHADASRPPDTDPDGVLKRASQHRPQDVALVIGLPTPKKNSWRVAMRPSHYHGVVGGLTQLWIDPWTYEVVEEKSPARWSTGDRIAAHQFPLHNGSLLGEPGRILAFLSGPAWCVLALTGFYMWWHKRRLQLKALEARAKRASAVGSGKSDGETSGREG